MIEEIVWYQYKQMNYKGTCACTKERDGLGKKMSSSQSTARRTTGQVDRSLKMTGKLNDFDVRAANGQ